MISSMGDYLKSFLEKPNGLQTYFLPLTLSGFVCRDQFHRRDFY